MKYRVFIEERAALDIAAHAAWITDAGAPLNAARWVDGIEEAIQSLATMPNRCPLAAESVVFDRDIRQLNFKSHRILFAVDRSVVHVLHVRHGARRPLAPDEE